MTMKNTSIFEIETGKVWQPLWNVEANEMVNELEDEEKLSIM